MRVLLDTNILLDFSLKRTPFFEAAKNVFSGNSLKYCDLFITSISISNFHYIASKVVGKTKSLAFLKDLTSICDVSVCNKHTIQLAITSKFSDFEDAIQYFSALADSLDVIITRNEKDFKHAAGIEIINPTAFVRKYL